MPFFIFPLALIQFILLHFTFTTKLSFPTLSTRFLVLQFLFIFFLFPFFLYLQFLFFFSLPFLSLTSLYHFLPQDHQIRPPTPFLSYPFVSWYYNSSLRCSISFLFYVYNSSFSFYLPFLSFSILYTISLLLFSSLSLVFFSIYSSSLLFSSISSFISLYTTPLFLSSPFLSLPTLYHFLNLAHHMRPSISSSITFHIIPLHSPSLSIRFYTLPLLRLLLFLLFSTLPPFLSPLLTCLCPSPLHHSFVSLFFFLLTSHTPSFPPIWATEESDGEMERERRRERWRDEVNKGR